MDLVKFRYQVFDKNSLVRPSYTSYYDAFKQIYRADGLRGLYNGASSNILGSGLAWGGYFFLYERLKQSKIFGNTTSTSTEFLNGVAAGFGVQVVTNPIWVVKTRCCLQY